MKLKKYSKYKDSGIDWIGEIPEKWSVRRLKFINKLQGGYAFKSDNFSYEGNSIIRIGDIKNNVDFDNSKKYPESIKIHKDFKIKNNDVLIALTGATIGKVGKVNHYLGKAYINQRVAKLSGVDNYYYYLLKSDFIKKQIELIGDGSAQENISNSQIEDFFIPFNEKQQNISSFLDSKTSQIEKLIKKDKKIIELLKEKRVSLINKAVTKGLDDSVEMKDSGVEWIGEIPEGWKVKRLFGVCRIVRGNSAFKKDELLEKGKYIALQYGKTYNVDEVNEQFQFYVNNEFYKSSQVVNYGDTILVSTSETVEDLGHTVFYKRKDTGLIGGEQILLKPNTNTIYNKYLFYSSRIFTKRLVQFATGVKVFRFNINDLNTTYLGVPAIEEQQKIVEFLDKKTLKIDNHIKKVEERIEFYEEYKKSVIYNVVTGKVEV